ncbi:unnamed protein product [Microthlaspi erraticum]|uniref:GAG-pre-integrase domain-containing protein n=1 Tax=Microthlaspi erraticum TaxID=1685480 RepID=A0A6D2I9Z4_9BRAS|nr:unnamed protein product [Microthlaspi erraticum]
MLNSGTKDLDKILSWAELGRVTLVWVIVEEKPVEDKVCEEALLSLNLRNHGVLVIVVTTRVKESNVILVVELWEESKGKELFLTTSLPNLKCLLVKGLTANLDKRIRSENNCYMWVQSDVYLRAENGNPVLWHEKLRHLNARSLSKMASQEIVEYVPKMKHGEKTVSETCSKGKQIRSDHGVSMIPKFFDQNGVSKTKPCKIISITEGKEDDHESLEEKSKEIVPFWVCKNHSPQHVKGRLGERKKTSGNPLNLKEMVMFSRFVSAVESKSFRDFLENCFWIFSVQEEFEDDNSVSQRTFAKNLVQQFMMCSNKSSKTHMSATMKQNCVFISISDASFIELGSFWIQLLWRRQMGSKYGMTSDLLLAKCDNQDAIDISGTFVHHSRTKSIDTRHLLIKN